MLVLSQPIENEREQEKGKHGGLLIEKGDQGGHESCASESRKNEISGSGPSPSDEIYGQDKKYLGDRQPDVLGCLQVEEPQRQDQQSDVEGIVEVRRVPGIENILDHGVVIGVPALQQSPSCSPEGVEVEMGLEVGVQDKKTSNRDYDDECVYRGSLHPASLLSGIPKRVGHRLSQF